MDPTANDTYFDTFEKMENADACNFVSMNIHGRFTGREIQTYGQMILKHVISGKGAALFFGQQTNFRPSLPEGYEQMGTAKAFILYDENQILAGDEKHYKLYLRDLETQGQLPKNYLPENNYIICKMKSKMIPSFEFIAMSWVTDECMGKLRAPSQFRKLCEFLDNLSHLEEMPIIVSGTFRLSVDEAKDMVPLSFRCCSYLPASRRRAARQSNFFICSRSLNVTDVKPLVCAKMNIAENGAMRRYINPEDAFFWDPVVATVKKKPEIPKPFFLQKEHLCKQAKTPSQQCVPNANCISGANGSVPSGATSSQNDCLDNKEDNSTVQSNDQHLEKQMDSEDDLSKDKEEKLKRVSSFVELYDEELVQNTGVCYMQ